MKATMMILRACAIILAFSGCSNGGVHLNDPKQIQESEKSDNRFLYTPPLAVPYSNEQESSDYLKGHEDAWNDGILGISLATIKEEIAEGLIHIKSSTPKKGKNPTYYHGWDDGKFTLAQRLNKVLRIGSLESQDRHLQKAQILIQKKRQ